ncbi:MAG: hypothetical protein CTY12_03470 [Methylotenera sp.]|nr:MAG: hypothetical protein CTY12_03470 [Methylotenera sp.]
MSKWTISKSFNFSYGHRVYTQQLVEEFSLDTSCKCKWLHGHNADVTVYFESDSLERGFVTDFKHANWISKFIDTFVDHKFILSIHDPWFNNIINGMLVGPLELDNGISTGRFKSLDHLRIPTDRTHQRYVPIQPVKVPNTEVVVGHILDVNSDCAVGLTPVFLDGPEKEFYEGFFLIDFVPTSENLSKWMFDFISPKMLEIGVRVSRIEFKETPKTMASYHD